MNNDISRDLTTYNKTRINHKTMPQSAYKDTMSEAQEDMPQGAMQCLDSLGHAQVNLNFGNSIRNSIKEFQQDPFKAQIQMDFCDSMVEENGYDIWKAMKITDTLFTALKDEETYRG